MGEPKSKLTELLSEYQKGDDSAFRAIWPEVNAELRRVAVKYLRNERSNHTLQPTALVNETFLKLNEGNKISISDRKHFFALAAGTMRRILIDYAKARNAEKRGGAGQRQVTLDESRFGEEIQLVDILALDHALTKLATESERTAKVVELKYFGGMTFEEIAETLEVSVITVKRDWNLAKLWLCRELESSQKA